MWILTRKPRFLCEDKDFYAKTLTLNMECTHMQAYARISPELRSVTWDGGSGTPHRSLIGKRLHPGRAGISPPRFPSQVLLIFSHQERKAGDARRRQQQQHDGVAQRPRATITRREIWLIRSGNYPLFLITLF